MITNAQGQNEVVIRDVPFTRKQVSVLGQKLAPPTPPDPSLFRLYPQLPKPPSSAGGVTVIIFGIIAFIISALCAAVAISTFSALVPTRSSQTGSVATAIVFVILTGGIFIVGCGLIGLGIFLIVRANKPDVKKQAEYQNQVEAVKRENEWITTNHENAIARWNAIYYCSRDDCIFIPGEGTSAPSANMKDYLTSPPPPPPVR